MITLEGIPYITSEDHYRLFKVDNKWHEKILSGGLLLSNHGDGIAYDVRVFGSYCDVAISPEGRDDAPFSIDYWTHRIPVLKSGSAVKLDVGFTYEGELDQWHWERRRAAVIVAWTTAPGRGRHRQLRRKLRRIEVEYPHKPGSTGLNRSNSSYKDKEGVIPFYVRYLRAIERRSLRGSKFKRLNYNDLWNIWD
ncbi:hypothetical protein [Mycobacteroides abscessus]|uniref:hypothetical protein n=1 Tax=Mycobacteroides abscessus TaxID=36809 RepID=UPI001045DADF|nr:hypothetical protein [Mycobacteroides abscessus]